MNFRHHRLTRPAVSLLLAAIAVAAWTQRFIFTRRMQVSISRAPGPDSNAFGGVTGARTRPLDALELLRSGDEDDLLAVFRERLLVPGGRTQVVEIFRALIRSAPGTALELMRRLMAEPEERHHLVADVMRSWAEMDPDKALEWLFQNAGDFPEEMAGLAEVVIHAAAVSRPNAMLRAVETAVSARQINDADAAGLAKVALSELWQQGHRDTVRAALQRWSGTELSTLLNNTLYEHVAHWLAGESASDAAVWLRNMPPSAGRDLALAKVAAIWSGHEPAAALAWCLTLSEADGRELVLQRAFFRYAERDFELAANWIAAHEMEPTIDQRIFELVSDSGLGDAHPRAGLAWAKLIRDERLRERSIDLVAMAWGRQDRVSAQRTIEMDGDFSPEQKLHLLRLISGEG